MIHHETQEGMRSHGGDNLSNTVLPAVSTSLMEERSVSHEIRRRIMMKMQRGIRRNHHATLTRRSNVEIGYGCSGVNRSP